MPIPEKQIENVMHILTQWNPLGDKASTVHDLDNYKTEAIDILFHIDLGGSRNNPARVIQDVLNQAFDLELSLDDCLDAAGKIKNILN
ncbi:MAG: DUF1871 family protein [Candidatus Scalinduaceae bacterium]